MTDKLKRVEDIERWVGVLGPCMREHEKRMKTVRDELLEEKAKLEKEIKEYEDAVEEDRKRWEDAREFAKDFVKGVDL